MAFLAIFGPFFSENFHEILMIFSWKKMRKKWEKKWQKKCEKNDQKNDEIFVKFFLKFS